MPQNDVMDLYLIRHGESEANKQKDLVGGRDNDTPLSERGRYQADLLGKRFKKFGVVFDEVYSSTAKRALETAERVGKRAGFSLDDVVATPEILEMDMGKWEGRPRVEVYTPEMIDKINSNNWRFAPPGGESQRAVEKRMLAWINHTIVSKYPQQANVAVFSHGMAIKCLFRGIMRSSPKQTYKINLDNTSITRLKYTKRGWHLITLNDTAHLLGQERMLDQYASG